MQLNLLATDVVGSEDCLYLNIWVPQGSTVSSNLPVRCSSMVVASCLVVVRVQNFLNNYLYDGQEIADRGNVIVVTFNYRYLNDDLSMSCSIGNYGLWDQHAAISWVHRNIRAFGGNPDNITIFGESAGGASVNFQILSPKNMGLIRRAISQSGVALCPWAVNRNPRQYAEEIARKVGCPTDSGMVACLRRTDPKTVTLAGSVNFNPIVHNLALSPVIDGDFLPGEPETLFGNAADIDYIAGVNDMDGHIFATIDIPSLNNALVSTPVFFKDPIKSETRFYEYTVNWGSKPSDTDVKKTIVDMETDYIFLVPTQATLYLHSDHAKSGRTYSYLFSEPSQLSTSNPTRESCSHLAVNMMLRFMQ
uniref:Carboxylic ester hydrolase n=1 Tax=Sinocyclocheilus rhinocerous TaxID=307959 RepID=A0A673LJ45_9TELE